ALFAFAQRSGLDLAAWARPLFRNASRGYGGYGTYGGASGGPSVGARMKRLLVREAPEEGPSRTAPARGSERRPGSPRSAAQNEVDRILDKILEDGFASLTDEEKRILDEASRRS